MKDFQFWKKKIKLILQKSRSLSKELTGHLRCVKRGYGFLKAQSKLTIRRILVLIRSLIRYSKHYIAAALKIIFDHETEIILVLVPLIFLMILLILKQVNKNISDLVSSEKMYVFQTTIPMQPYPVLDKVFEPGISAQAAIIMDDTSQVVLYAKDPEIRFSMASTTKIMTAMVALDYYKNDSVLTIKSENVEGSRLNFYKGENFYFYDLLSAMLLPSANDAAFAIADNYPGGKDEFVRKMNEKAAELNLNDTHYYDPAGLDDDENFTTVGDLAKLTSVAIKNKIFSEVIATKKRTISDLNGTKDYTLVTLNKLLGTDGVNGVKTGTTEGAGEVLVTSKIENGHTFIMIVMKSQDRFEDTKKLLSLVSNNVNFIIPVFSQ